MPRRLLILLLLVLTSCGAAKSAQTVQDCTGLASDIARSGIGGVPNAAQVGQTITQLQARIAKIDAPGPQKAAVTLLNKTRALQTALNRGDPVGVERAGADVRTAASAAAKACNLPVSRFLG